MIAKYDSEWITVLGCFLFVVLMTACTVITFVQAFSSPICGGVP